MRNEVMMLEDASRAVAMPARVHQAPGCSSSSAACPAVLAHPAVARTLLSPQLLPKRTNQRLLTFASIKACTFCESDSTRPSLSRFKGCQVRVAVFSAEPPTTMAEKEATVFILDLGASMAKAHSGRTESDLDWSMRYVWDKITDIVSANRKTLCVGVVGLRTDETSNKLQDESGYENISVLQELGPMSMTSLKTLQSSIKPSKTWSGDAISAIVIAVEMIDSFTKKLKWNRKIVMITDAQSGIDPDDIGDIAQKMNDSNINLTIL